MKLQSPPLRLMIHDFPVSTEIYERPAVIEYDLLLKRTAVGEPWEVDRVAWSGITRNVNGGEVYYEIYSMGKTVYVDLRLELVAVLSESPEDFQRLQDAANAAVASLGSSNEVEE